MPQNIYSKKSNPETTTALPTAEEIRHQYGDVMNYVKSLAARAKRVAERKGKKDQTKAIEEDLQVILTDLGQALTDDIHRVEADKKPFSHDDLKEIMKKRYSTFSDLASDYFGDGDDEENGSDEPDEKDKPKAYYLIDGKPLAMDDPTAVLLVATAISEGKAIQQFQLNDAGMPVITTVVEAKGKKKPKKSGDPTPDADDDDDAIDTDSDEDDVKWLTIRFKRRKVKVPTITETVGSGKSKKSITLALAAEDGSEVFSSFEDADAFADTVVWYELARIKDGITRSGKPIYSYELKSSSPVKENFK